jgi:hypothetical protein
LVLIGNFMLVSLLSLVERKAPALIYSLVKVMKYKKEVYFKFLSESFQSLEGSSPILI